MDPYHLLPCGCAFTPSTYCKEVELFEASYKGMQWELDIKEGRIIHSSCRNNAHKCKSLDEKVGNG